MTKQDDLMYFALSPSPYTTTTFRRGHGVFVRGERKNFAAFKLGLCSHLEFAEGIGCAHLNTLIKNCKMNNTTHEIPEAIGDKDLLIPKAEDSHPSYYKFAGMPPGALRKRLDAIDEAEFDSIENDINWTLIGVASDLAEEAMRRSASVDRCTCIFCLLTCIRLSRAFEWMTTRPKKVSGNSVGKWDRMYLYVLNVMCAD